MNYTLDPEALREAAAIRGMSVSSLFAAAGVSRRALAKVNRREPIRASIARRLEDVIASTPVLSHVEVIEAAS